MTPKTEEHEFKEEKESNTHQQATVEDQEDDVNDDTDMCLDEVEQADPPLVVESAKERRKLEEDLLSHYTILADMAEDAQEQTSQAMEKRDDLKAKTKLYEDKVVRRESRYANFGKAISKVSKMLDDLKKGGPVAVLRPQMDSLMADLQKQYPGYVHMLDPAFSGGQQPAHLQEEKKDKTQPNKATVDAGGVDAAMETNNTATTAADISDHSDQDMGGSPTPHVVSEVTRLNVQVYAPFGPGADEFQPYNPTLDQYIRMEVGHYHAPGLPPDIPKSVLWPVIAIMEVDGARVSYFISIGTADINYRPLAGGRAARDNRGHPVVPEEMLYRPEIAHLPHKLQVLPPDIRFQEVLGSQNAGVIEEKVRKVIRDVMGSEGWTNGDQ